MMQLIRRTAGIVATALFVGALTTPADPIAIGLTVTPGKFEAQMALGASYNLPVTINNGSTNATHVVVTPQDFTLTENGDYVFKPVGTDANSLLKWASINPRQFDLGAGQTQQVQLTVSIPSDQSLSGEYAGVIFYTTRPERHGGGVAFSAQVAEKIYITISGTERIAGAIVKMATAKTSSGQQYRVLFKNMGNGHIYTRGQLVVQQGSAVVDQVALPDNQLVERAGERLFIVKGKRLSPGSYQAIATMDYGGKTETGGAINFDVH